MGYARRIECGYDMATAGCESFYGAEMDAGSVGTGVDGECGWSDEGHCRNDGGKVWKYCVKREVRRRF